MTHTTSKLALTCSLLIATGCFGTGTDATPDEESGTTTTDATDKGDDTTVTSTNGTPPNGTTGDDADDSSDSALDGSTSDDGSDESTSSTAEPPPPMEYPASCAAWIQEDPGSPDGIYTIDVDGLGGLEPFDVRCDMTTEGGGWTLVALNDETTTFVQFDRSWQEYADGFGDLPSMSIGWLGNHRLHALTQGGVQLQVRDDHDVHGYVGFSIGDEPSNFELSVEEAGMSGDGGHFVSGHHGRPFSTYDNDNDNHADNCADNNNAGWWYDACFSVSIASGQPGAQVYWRHPPNFGAPGYVAWIQLWVR